MDFYFEVTIALFSTPSGSVKLSGNVRYHRFLFMLVTFLPLLSLLFLKNKLKDNIFGGECMIASSWVYNR